MAEIYTEAGRVGHMVCDGITFAYLYRDITTTVRILRGRTIVVKTVGKEMHIVYVGAEMMQGGSFEEINDRHARSLEEEFLEN